MADPLSFGELEQAWYALKYQMTFALRQYDCAKEEDAEVAERIRIMVLGFYRQLETMSTEFVDRWGLSVSELNSLRVIPASEAQEAFKQLQRWQVYYSLMKVSGQI